MRRFRNPCARKDSTLMFPMFGGKSLTAALRLSVGVLCCFILTSPTIERSASILAVNSPIVNRPTLHWTCKRQSSPKALRFEVI